MQLKTVNICKIFKRVQYIPILMPLRQPNVVYEVQAT